MNGDLKETKENIRIIPESFRKLVEIIPEKLYGWSIEIEVIVFLFWLACGTSYRVVSKAMIMPKSTIKNIIHKYLNIFETLAKDVVQKPPALTALDDIGIKFANKARSEIFRKAVGAIDGCHIKIKCPPNQRDQYINRKLDYSIQLQAVCDAEYKIFNMCCGYPGSVHDQRVLVNSQLYRSAQFPPEGYFLLGDAGYKCMVNPICILTPYKGYQMTEAQTRFNHAHSKARITIEQTFGMMKSRWRAIFFKTLELQVKRCVQVVCACCVMHNICLAAGDFTDFDSTEIVPTENVSSGLRDHRDAIQFRNELCSRM